MIAAKPTFGPIPACARYHVPPNESPALLAMLKIERSLNDVTCPGWLMLSPMAGLISFHSEISGEH